jgi:hypothetical protein
LTQILASKAIDETLFRLESSKSRFRRTARAVADTSQSITLPILGSAKAPTAKAVWTSDRKSDIVKKNTNSSGGLIDSFKSALLQ